MNRLFYGDCLTIMRNELSVNSVDLIYLDPPFNSNRAYNAIYKDETGRPLPDQIEAFCDLWTLDEAREREIKHMPILLRKCGIDDDIVSFWQLWMNALRRTDPKMLAYLGLHGATLGGDAHVAAAKRLDLFALRPHSKLLH